jgi:hypothetical protein
MRQRLNRQTVKNYSAHAANCRIQQSGNVTFIQTSAFCAAHVICSRMMKTTILTLRQTDLMRANTAQGAGAFTRAAPAINDNQHLVGQPPIRCIFYGQ